MSGRPKSRMDFACAVLDDRCRVLANDRWSQSQTRRLKSKIPHAADRFLARSFVLVAVLVVITGAVLVGTSMMFIAQGRAVDTSSTAEATQMRALAWSGVQLVMAELNDQREQLLSGQTPRLDRQYAVYDTASRAGVVRLLAMSADGRTLFSAEAGKLDLNSATPGMLGLTGMVEPAAAEAIVTHRDHTLKRPYQSIAELLHVPGASITPRALYGPIEELKPRDDAQQEARDLGERVAARLQSDRVRGLADVVTVFAVEPVLQRDGRPRINLNQPWSDDLGKAIAARFDEQAAQQVKSMMEAGTKFETEAAIVKTLIDAKVEPRLWPDLLDAFTAESGEFHFGRLDINTAPLPALMALPEITAAQAAQIASMRQQLSDDEKASIAWPVIAQIIPPQTLVALAGRITTRCLVYRVRIAAGEVNADEPDGPMSSPVILEAVIDLTAPTPRVAYVRDISVLQAAAQIALEASRNQPLIDLPDEAGDEGKSGAGGAEDAARPLADATNNETAALPDAGSQPDPSATRSATEQSTNTASATPRRVGRWLNGG